MDGIAKSVDEIFNHVREFSDRCRKDPNLRKPMKVSSRMRKMMQSVGTGYNRERANSIGRTMVYSGVVDYLHTQLDIQLIRKTYRTMTDVDRIISLPDYERYQLSQEKPKEIKIERDTLPYTEHFYVENEEILADYGMLATITGYNCWTDVLRLHLIYHFRNTKYFWPFDYEHEYHWKERFEIIEPYLEKEPKQIISLVNSEKAEEESMEA